MIASISSNSSSCVILIELVSWLSGLVYSNSTKARPFTGEDAEGGDENIYLWIASLITAPYSTVAIIPYFRSIDITNEGKIVSFYCRFTVVSVVYNYSNDNTGFCLVHVRTAFYLR